jgi:23S rRNA (uridine2552-2'-O)-methyltransferase
LPSWRLDFACHWLKPDGAFLVKVFQGHGFNDFLQEMRQTFKTVSSRKPDASSVIAARRSICWARP